MFMPKVVKLPINVHSAQPHHALSHFTVELGQPASQCDALITVTEQFEWLRFPFLHFKN